MQTGRLYGEFVVYMCVFVAVVAEKWLHTIETMGHVLAESLFCWMPKWVKVSDGWSDDFVFQNYLFKNGIACSNCCVRVHNYLNLAKTNFGQHGVQIQWNKVNRIGFQSMQLCLLCHAFSHIFFFIFFYVVHRQHQTTSNPH